MLDNNALLQVHLALAFKPRNQVYQPSLINLTIPA
jgi:hypothetical protein